jgi:hypothetical protein
MPHFKKKIEKIENAIQGFEMVSKTLMMKIVRVE